MVSVSAIRFFGFFFAILGLLFLIIATPTHHWYHAEVTHPATNQTFTYYGGIFETCVKSSQDKSYTCVTQESSGYIKATKAFLVLAILEFIGVVIYTLILAFTRGICYKVLGVLTLVAGLLTMIAMAIYTDKHALIDGAVITYGYSYGLGWASTVFSIIAGIILCFGQADYEKL